MPTWITNTSEGPIGANYLQQYGPMLREGVEGDKIWGYGRRRITVTDNSGTCPMTFSAMGFKNQNGTWSIGLRMNVDQASPIKFQNWENDNQILSILTTLMMQHMQDLGYTNNYGIVI